MNTTRGGSTLLAAKSAGNSRHASPPQCPSERYKCSIYEVLVREGVVVDEGGAVGGNGSSAGGSSVGGVGRSTPPIAGPPSSGGGSGTPPYARPIAPCSPFAHEAFRFEDIVAEADFNELDPPQEGPPTTTTSAAAAPQPSRHQPSASTAAPPLPPQPSSSPSVFCDLQQQQQQQQELFLRNALLLHSLDSDYVFAKALRFANVLVEEEAKAREEAQRLQRLQLQRQHRRMAVLHMHHHQTRGYGSGNHHGGSSLPPTSNNNTTHTVNLTGGGGADSSSSPINIFGATQRSHFGGSSPHPPSWEPTPMLIPTSVAGTSIPPLSMHCEIAMPPRSPSVGVAPPHGSNPLGMSGKEREDGGGTMGWANSSATTMATQSITSTSLPPSVPLGQRESHRDPRDGSAVAYGQHNNSGSGFHNPPPLLHGFSSGYFRNANINPPPANPNSSNPDASFGYGSSANGTGTAAVMIPNNSSPNLLEGYVAVGRQRSGVSPHRMQRGQSSHFHWNNNNSIFSVASASGGVEHSTHTGAAPIVGAGGGEEEDGLAHHHHHPYSLDHHHHGAADGHAFTFHPSRANRSMSGGPLGGYGGAATAMMRNDSMCGVPPPNLSTFTARGSFAGRAASGGVGGNGCHSQDSSLREESRSGGMLGRAEGSGGGMVRGPWDGSGTMVSIDALDDFVDIPLVGPTPQQHPLTTFCDTFCKAGVRSLERYCATIQRMSSVVDESAPVIACLFVRLHRRLMGIVLDVLWARRQFHVGRLRAAQQRQQRQQNSLLEGSGGKKSSPRELPAHHNTSGNSGDGTTPPRNSAGHQSGLVRSPPTHAHPLQGGGGNSEFANSIGGESCRDALSIATSQPLSRQQTPAPEGLQANISSAATSPSLPPRSPYFPPALAPSPYSPITSQPPPLLLSAADTALYARLREDFAVPIPVTACNRLLTACIMLGTKLCSDKRHDCKYFATLTGLGSEQADLPTYEYEALRVLGYDSLFVHAEHLDALVLGMDPPSPQQRAEGAQQKGRSATEDRLVADRQHSNGGGGEALPMRRSGTAASSDDDDGDGTPDSARYRPMPPSPTFEDGDDGYHNDHNPRQTALPPSAAACDEPSPVRTTTHNLLSPSADALPLMMNTSNARDRQTHSNSAVCATGGSSTNRSVLLTTSTSCAAVVSPPLEGGAGGIVVGSALASAAAFNAAQQQHLLRAQQRASHVKKVAMEDFEDEARERMRMATVTQQLAFNQSVDGFATGNAGARQVHSAEAAASQGGGGAASSNSAPATRPINTSDETPPLRARPPNASAEDDASPLSSASTTSAMSVAAVGMGAPSPSASSSAPPPMSVPPPTLSISSFISQGAIDIIQESIEARQHARSMASSVAAVNKGNRYSILGRGGISGDGDAAARGGDGAVLFSPLNALAPSPTPQTPSPSPTTAAAAASGTENAVGAGALFAPTTSSTVSTGVAVPISPLTEHTQGSSSSTMGMPSDSTATATEGGVGGSSSGHVGMLPSASDGTAGGGSSSTANGMMGMCGMGSAAGSQPSMDTVAGVSSSSPTMTAAQHISKSATPTMSAASAPRTFTTTSTATGAKWITTATATNSAIMGANSALPPFYRNAPPPNGDAAPLTSISQPFRPPPPLAGGVGASRNVFSTSHANHLNISSNNTAAVVAAAYYSVVSSPSPMSAGSYPSGMASPVPFVSPPNSGGGGAVEGSGAPLLPGYPPQLPSHHHHGGVAGPTAVDSANTVRSPMYSRGPPTAGCSSSGSSRQHTTCSAETAGYGVGSGGGGAVGPTCSFPPPTTVPVAGGVVYGSFPDTPPSGGGGGGSGAVGGGASSAYSSMACRASAGTPPLQLRTPPMGLASGDFSHVRGLAMRIQQQQQQQQQYTHSMNHAMGCSPNRAASPPLSGGGEPLAGGDWRGNNTRAMPHAVNSYPDFDVVSEASSTYTTLAQKIRAVPNYEGITRPSIPSALAGMAGTAAGGGDLGGCEYGGHHAQHQYFSNDNAYGGVGYRMTSPTLSQLGCDFPLHAGGGVGAAGEYGAIYGSFPTPPMGMSNAEEEEGGGPSAAAAAEDPCVVAEEGRVDGARRDSALSGVGDVSSFAGGAVHFVPSSGANSAGGGIDPLNFSAVRDGAAASALLGGSDTHTAAYAGSPQHPANADATAFATVKATTHANTAANSGAASTVEPSSPNNINTAVVPPPPSSCAEPPSGLPAPRPRPPPPLFTTSSTFPRNTTHSSISAAATSASAAAVSSPVGSGGALGVIRGGALKTPVGQFKGSHFGGTVLTAASLRAAREAREAAEREAAAGVATTSVNSGGASSTAAAVNIGKGLVSDDIPLPMAAGAVRAAASAAVSTATIFTPPTASLPVTVPPPHNAAHKPSAMPRLDFEDYY